MYAAPAFNEIAVASAAATSSRVASALINGGLLPIQRMGGTGAELDILCGRFLYNRDSMLFAALPGHVLISSADLQASDHLPALSSVLSG